MSEQLIENNDPRFVKKLYMCVGKPIGAIDWLTQITTSRKEAERLQQEGWAVSEYTRLGFLKPLEAQSA